MKIYLKLESKPESIKDLLDKLNSYDKVQIICGVETFEDEECTIQQCPAGKMRSFDDIFDIVNTYFPGTSEKEIVHELIISKKVRKDGMTLVPHLSTCSTMKRIRFMYYTTDTGSIYEGKYESKYSWGELLAMLDINTYDQLVKYVAENTVKKEELIPA